MFQHDDVENSQSLLLQVTNGDGQILIVKGGYGMMTVDTPSNFRDTDNDLKTRPTTSSLTGSIAV